MFEICLDRNRTASMHYHEKIIVIVVKGPIFYSGNYFISVNHITSKHQFFLLQLGLITNWVTVT